MNLLFISRTFPPVVGGIERQNAEIARALAARCNVRVIANRRGKFLLPLFLPWATLRALLLLPRYDAVLLGDGVLGITGYILKLFSRKPVLCIVHGLDLTYRNRVYQRLWVRSFLPRLDRLIAVGNATAAEGEQRGIPRAHLVHIPNGVAVPNPPLRKRSRDDLATLIGRKPQGTVLLTLGRLVKRKGVAWFVDNVVPLLDTDIIYIVAGSGPEQEHITAAIESRSLGERVVLLGNISETDKELLFAAADLFIQPNIPVRGDIEGFGLVVLEAAVHGLVVVASNLEGLADAVQDGVNGYLVSPENAREFTARIAALLADRDAMQNFGRQAAARTAATHGWPLIAEQYLEEIRRLTRQPDDTAAHV